MTANPRTTRAFDRSSSARQTTREVRRLVLKERPEVKSATAPTLSLVIPTYNERENIEILAGELLELFRRFGITGELIVVDDASPDGTGRFVEELSTKNTRIRVVHRPGKLGLSSAVIDGFEVARGGLLGVMDADLSHPVEALPRMLESMTGDVDFVIGSRYVVGGGTDGWPAPRRIVSKTACALARPFTSVKDPMSGFFLIRRSCLTGAQLSPRGFKICLDLLVKADYRSVKEVPIRFVDRQHGASKLGRGEVLHLLSNLFSYLLEGRHRR